MTTHNELLILQLLGDIFRSRSRYFDPCFGKKSTCSENKGNVNNEVNRILKGSEETVRGSNEIGDSTGCRNLA
jgi:hypothetical protein